MTNEQWPKPWGLLVTRRFYHLLCWGLWWRTVGTPINKPNEIWMSTLKIPTIHRMVDCSREGPWGHATVLQATSPPRRISWEVSSDPEEGTAQQTPRSSTTFASATARDRSQKLFLGKSSWLSQGFFQSRHFWALSGSAGKRDDLTWPDLTILGGCHWRHPVMRTFPTPRTNSAISDLQQQVDSCNISYS